MSKGTVRRERQTRGAAARGIIARALGAVRALTQGSEGRKRAEEALRESEAELSAIYDNAPLVMILVDRDRRVQKVNYAAVKFTQRAVEDMIGRRGGEALRCVHSVDDPRGCGFGPSCGPCPVRGVVLDTFDTGNDHYQLEAKLQFVSREGETTVLVSTTLLSLPEGQRVLVCIEDVTERKRAEEALRDSEARLQSIYEAAIEGIVIHEKGVIVDANVAFEKLLGYPLSELIGMSIIELTAEESRALLEEKIRSETQQPYEAVGLRKDGTTFRATISSKDHMYRGRSARVAAVHDITERKRAEESLRESEEKYRELVELSPDAILLHQGGNVAFANTRTLELVGAQDPTQVMGKPITDFIHPDYHDAVRKRTQELLEEGTPLPPAERRLVRVDGTTVDTEVSAALVSHDGKPAVQSVIRDITERKRAEEALRERTYDLGERVKELNCLYGITRLVEQPGISLEEIVQGTADIIPPGWQYPEVTCARIIVEGQEFRTENFSETPWRQTADMTVRGERIGSVEVRYLEKRPESDEGPFLKDERSLINAIAERLGEAAERKRAEEALRKAREELEARVEHQMLRRNPYGLTFRELTVLHLVAAGQSDKEIGTTLGISPLTAQKHIENLRIKLEAASRTEASVRAVREGLLD